jgi:hypothetical protein
MTGLEDSLFLLLITKEILEGLAPSTTKTSLPGSLNPETFCFSSSQLQN